MSKQNLTRNQLPIIYSLFFIAAANLIISVIFSYVNLRELLEQMQYESLGVLSVFLLQEVIFILPVAYLIARQSDYFKDLKFKKFKFWPAVGWIFLGFVAFFSINLVITFISEYFSIQIPGYGIQEEHLPIFGADKFSLPVAFLVLLFIAPFVEEIVFRGFIYSKLRKNYSMIASILLSATIFAAIHLEFQVIIPLFILGAIIAFIYEKTDSIWPAIIFHMINNSLAFGIELML